MNHTIFWRLVWKEYRLQRAWWIAMAALSTLALLFVYEFWVNPGERIVGLFAAAVGGAALYALGCGATLFAGEHDAETFEFQRALPVGSMRLFLAKIVFALVSAAAMLASGWLLAAWLSGWELPTPRQQAMIWSMPGFYGVEIFVWAALFSLILRQPMLSLILGVTAASVSVHILASYINPYFDWPRYVAAMPYRLIPVAIIALVDVWLGARWAAPTATGPMEA